MEDFYINRLAESTLERKLHSCGCVLVKGPKFCGKSTLCEHYAKSLIALKTMASIELGKSDPKSLLKGETPRLIDEWQKVPEIWDLIKDDLDKQYEFGKYILTGSTTPIDPTMIQNSAAGRITSMILRPFSLYESGESSGLVSLHSLFCDDFSLTPVFDTNTSLEDIAFYICRGGWPISIRADKKYAIDVTENYFSGLFTIENESDEFSEFLKNKNIDLLNTILREFARNISTQAKTTTMISDILESGERSKLDEDTFLSYKKTLKDLFIIYDMPAWNFNLRTSVSVRTSPTIHFFDTSIATASLGITPLDLLNDLRSFGLFFEDFSVRDLSIYADSFGGELKHYRDSSNQEIDAVLKLPNGEYGVIEIKIWSEKNILEGKKSLLSFERKLASSNLKLPKFKMILTSHGPCYKTAEGIYVVPITMLKN